MKFALAVIVVVALVALGEREPVMGKVSGQDMEIPKVFKNLEQDESKKIIIVKCLLESLGKTVSKESIIQRPNGDKWMVICSRMTLGLLHSYAAVGVQTAQGVQPFKLRLDYPNHKFVNITLECQAKIGTMMLQGPQGADLKAATENKGHKMFIVNVDVDGSNSTKPHHTFLIDTPSFFHAKILMKSMKVVHSADKKNVTINFSYRFD